MIKPDKVIFSDGELTLKEVCKMFNATTIIMDNVKYKTPEAWNEKNNS